MNVGIFTYMKTVDFYGFSSLVNIPVSHGSHFGYVFFTARSKVACAEAAELLEGARRRCLVALVAWWPAWVAGGVGKVHKSN